MTHGTDLFVRDEIELRRPKWFAVRLLNDDKTSFQFVERCCRDIFHKTSQEARLIAKTVDSSGYADVVGPDGPFTLEVAEEKACQCMDRANRENYPFAADPIEV